MPDVSLDTLPLLLALLVPGFVWAQVHRYLQVTPSEQRDSWLGVFTLSALNYGVWSWLIPVLWISTVRSINEETSPPIRTLAGWFLVTLVSPAALGTLSGFVHRKSVLRRWLRRTLRVFVPSPIGTAWDYVFSERTEDRALWATVTLADGSVVEGCFASRSLASSKPAERDLFLEYQFKPDARGELQPVERSAGVWIAASAIKAVEFKAIQVRDTPEVQDAE